MLCLCLLRLVTKYFIIVSGGLEYKTRYNRFETPPNAIKTQVIYTKRKVKSIIFSPLFWTIFCAIAVNCIQNSYKNAVTQCHVACWRFLKGTWATCGFTTPLKFGHFTLLSARVHLTPPAHFGKIKQSHTELAFHHLLLLLFCFSLLFVFACTFLFCILWNINKKHLKCKRIYKLLSCFYFPRSDWRKWPEVAITNFNITTLVKVERRQRKFRKNMQ